MKAPIKLIDITGGRVELFDAPSETYREENLACFNSDGSLRWRAALPANTGSDTFIDMRLDGDFIQATTWSGWAILLDCATGVHINNTFTK